MNENEKLYQTKSLKSFSNNCSYSTIYEFFQNYNPISKALKHGMLCSSC